MRQSLLLVCLVSFVGSTAARAADGIPSLEQEARLYRQTLYACFQNRPNDYRLAVEQCNRLLETWKDADSPPQAETAIRQWFVDARQAAIAGLAPPSVPRVEIPPGSHGLRQAASPAVAPRHAQAIPEGAKGAMPRIVRGSRMVPSQQTPRAALAHQPPNPTSIPARKDKEPGADVDLEAVLALAQQQRAGQLSPASPPPGASGEQLVRALLNLNSELEKQGVLDNLPAPDGEPKPAPSRFPASDLLVSPLLKGVIRSLWSSK